MPPVDLEQHFPHVSLCVQVLADMHALALKHNIPVDPRYQPIIASLAKTFPPGCPPVKTSPFAYNGDLELLQSTMNRSPVPMVRWLLINLEEGMPDTLDLDDSDKTTTTDAHVLLLTIAVQHMLKESKTIGLDVAQKELRKAGAWVKAAASSIEDRAEPHSFCGACGRACVEYFAAVHTDVSVQAAAGRLLEALG